MSRRRKPEDEQTATDRAHRWKSDVVCADRGQHGLIRLASLYWVSNVAYPDPRDERQWQIRMTPVRERRRYFAGEYHDDEGHRLFWFDCPECHRNVPLRWEKAEAMIAAKVRAGKWDEMTLDISHLC